MINQKVEIALIMAIREAKKRHHEHVTVEHILYGLLDFLLQGSLSKVYY